MNTEKIVINPTGAVTEVIVREGAAAKVLDPKPPIKQDISGTIETPYEWLSKRLGSEQFDIKDCHLLVNREDISITLITNEADDLIRGKIKGSLQIEPKFLEFGINTGKIWSPTELGIFIKMNRAFFSDKTIAMGLTTSLMNFTASVNSAIERTVKESGDRTDNFSQVVNSNLPSAFNLQIKLFKGSEKRDITVETFANIDGKTVAFTLLSPGALELTEEIRDKAIDEQIEKIKALVPELAIIEQ